jgi:hypothetical protein
MSKVLHISYHLGCFSDQQYILNKLGMHIDNFSAAAIGSHTITHEIADNFWKQNKDKINSYDYVLISDTSALSRIILQNIQEFKSKLVIWICNRFDYAMWNEHEFYKLFNAHRFHPQVKFVAYTLWEKIWCLKRGIDIMHCPVITPLGKSNPELDYNIPGKLNHFKALRDAYNGNAEETVFVPNYCNDNVYFKMADYLNSVGVPAYNGPFSHPDQLADFRAYVTSPDAMSKLFCFESIHSKIPVVLPSQRRLLELTKGNYLFNMTGHGGGQALTEDMTIFCEWYREDFKPVRTYYDTLEELPSKIDSIDKSSLTAIFEKLSHSLETETLTKWSKLYASF